MQSDRDNRLTLWRVAVVAMWLPPHTFNRRDKRLGNQTMATDPFSRSRSLQREIAERLSSFFVAATDGRSVSLDAGAAVATAQGPHRERNEDRCAVVRFRFGSMRPDLRLGILCDGMGGMAKGGEAASLALGAFIAERAASSSRSFCA